MRNHTNHDTASTLRITGWLATGLGVLATTALSLAVADHAPASATAPAATVTMAPALQPDPVILRTSYDDCLRNVGGTADRLERASERCRAEAHSIALVEAHYVECMRDAARTADALMEWVETCRAQAMAAVG